MRFVADVRSLAVKKTDVSEQSTGGWRFLTNHAHVLLCIARDPDARVRDIAQVVGITERAAQRILADLIGEGYATSTKVGRRNCYDVNPDGHLRHPFFSSLSVGPLLDMLNTGGHSGPGDQG
jgi:DNA-binding MarR family transcriptional regulator